MRFLAYIILFSTYLSACSSTQPLVQTDNWMFQKFIRSDEYNPILEPDIQAHFTCPIRQKKVYWAAKNVFNPAAIVHDGRVWMLFRAQDDRGTSRIGLANSRDGFDFRKRPDPVLYPDVDALKNLEWNGGCEDPRVVSRKDGLFIMTYTAYDGNIAHLCIATSKDFVHWQKHGPVLTAKKYHKRWSKSGAIVCTRKGSRIVAKKINGKYRMYWGDSDLFMATSDDLIHWQPLEDKRGNLLSVMGPRPGMFDSKLVEPGPFALLRKDGILLLYNGANSAIDGDKTLAPNGYAIGQALFSSSKPTQLIGRADHCLLSPERYFEKEGAVNNVCFLEGMVWFNDHWMLYYGAGDSRIGVAECWEN
jgi:beta-1,2-mannosidase